MARGIHRFGPLVETIDHRNPDPEWSDWAELQPRQLSGLEQMIDDAYWALVGAGIALVLAAVVWVVRWLLGRWL